MPEVVESVAVNVVVEVGVHILIEHERDCCWRGIDGTGEIAEPELRVAVWVVEFHVVSDCRLQLTELLGGGALSACLFECLLLCLLFFLLLTLEGGYSALCGDFLFEAVLDAEFLLVSHTSVMQMYGYEYHYDEKYKEEELEIEEN